MELPQDSTGLAEPDDRPSHQDSPKRHKKVGSFTQFSFIQSHLIHSLRVFGICSLWIIMRLVFIDHTLTCITVLHILTPFWSRSPQRDQHTTSSRPSPFFRPPGWQPPVPQSHRPIILQVDLKPMQQLALRDPYYNILSPQVAGNLSTEEYDSLFQAYKVIYPEYASRHYSALDHGFLSIATDQGNQMLDQPRHTILDILNWHYPSWKTHQHVYAPPGRVTETQPIFPHPDASETGLVVRVESIPRGHPFFSSNAAGEQCTLRHRRTTSREKLARHVRL